MGYDEITSESSSLRICTATYKFNKKLKTNRFAPSLLPV